jgi:tetratricopeptide (TPR) repeat protein
MPRTLTKECGFATRIKTANITERKIEIYHAQDDDYVFAWCCSKQEPRTFIRFSILAWRLLPERYEPDPNVERYWREEGTRDYKERIPWRRWVMGLSNDEAAKYARLSESGVYPIAPTIDDAPATANTLAPIDTPSWYQQQEQALLAYSKMTSSNVADYQEVIRLATAAINGGASVYAQARLYRVLGEIYVHCGQKDDAVENLERAVRLDSHIGVKKLLARLKAQAGV